MSNKGVNASGGLVLDNGGRVCRRRVTPVVELAAARGGRAGDSRMVSGRPSKSLGFFRLAGGRDGGGVRRWNRAAWKPMG